MTIVLMRTPQNNHKSLKLIMKRKKWMKI